MSQRARAVLLGFFAALAACSAFDASNDDPPTDAPVDAGVDRGPVPDANVRSDGGATPLEAGTRDERCDHPDLGWCDDFNRAELTGSWSGPVFDQGGALSIEDGTEGNRVLTFRGPPGVRSIGYLQRTLAALGTPARFTLRYSLRADVLQKATTAQEFATLAELVIPVGDGRTQRLFTTLNEVPGTLRMELALTPPSGASEFSEASLGTFPLEVWNTVILHVDLASKTIQAETSFGPSVRMDLKPATQAAMTPGVITAFVGASYANPTTTGWTVSIDDYMLTVDP